ncbi:MAG: hypothetical protein R3F60_20895 [bacterium]
MSEPDDDIVGVLEAGAVHHGAGAAVDVATLLAWRRGRLDAEAAEALEARLARDPEARALLAGLAEAPPTAASTWPQAHWPARRFPRRVVAGFAAAAAAAAAILFFVWPTSASLPPYSLEGPTGATREVRGEERRVPFRPGDTLRVTLRPAHRHAEPPAVAAFVVGADGRLAARPVDAAPEPSGIVRVSARAATLLGPAPGPSRVVIALAPPGVDLAGLAGRPLADVSAALADVQWLEFTAELAGGDPPP